MFSKSVFFGVLILCFTMSGITAKEFNLAQILTLAEKQSKDLQLAKSELEMATTRIDEAWALALPTLSADLNYNKNLKDQIFYATIPDIVTGEPTIQKFDFSFENEFSATAELKQTLYSFGKVGKALEIAYQYEDFAKRNFQFQKQNILINTKISFYNAVLAKKVFELTLDSESSARDNYNEIKNRYESGAASEFELLQAEVRWRNAVPQTIASKKNTS